MYLLCMHNVNDYFGKEGSFAIAISQQHCCYAQPKAFTRFVPKLIWYATIIHPAARIRPSVYKTNKREKKVALPIYYQFAMNANGTFCL